MSTQLPPPPPGMCYLPNGDLTTHDLMWSGMPGSEWCHCTACDYAPDWYMTMGPNKTEAAEADLTCPKTGRNKSP